MSKQQIAEASAQYIAVTAMDGGDIGMVEAAIPKDYKQTEVGVIPEDWDTPRFGHICTLVNGRGFKPYEWSNEGLPIIRIQNLNGSADFNYYNGHFDPKIFIEHGQLLFAWSGSRGTSFGPHVWKGGDALLNYHTWKLVIRESAVDENYFFHILKALTKQIEDSAHGASALVHTQKGEMEQFYVPLPNSKEEQTAIANALSDVDALINGLEKAIAKKQAIKTATMQQLLTGRTRLPQFAHHPDGTSKGYKSSELGEVPEDWEVGVTSDLIEKMSSGLSRRLVAHDIGIPVLISGNIQDNKLVTDELRYWYKPDPQGANIEDYVLNDGDILLCFINSMAQIGKPCVFSDIGRPAIFTTNLFRIIVSNNSSSRFAYYLFSTEHFQKEIQIISKIAVNQASFTKPDFLGIKITFPSTKEEQIAISTILSDMDEEIQTLQQRLSKTRQLKQGMMQELLTGKTRLNGR